MQFDEIRRRSDGSVDVDYYRSRAQWLRSREETRIWHQVGVKIARGVGKCAHVVSSTLGWA